jgi:hypothetical protein
VRSCIHLAPLSRMRSASACPYVRPLPLLYKYQVAATRESVLKEVYQVAATRESVLKEVTWITEASAMDMPWAWQGGHCNEPLLNRQILHQNAPAARRERRRRAGLRADEMPDRCTACCKVPLRMPRRSVSCAARVGQRMLWLASEWRREAPCSHTAR